MNKEQARLQEIVRALHEPEVFCEGCGHHGEPNGCNLNGVGCKAWDYAQEAADLIESLQREQKHCPVCAEREEKNAAYIAMLMHEPLPKDQPKLGVMLNMDNRPNVPINVKLNGQWHTGSAEEFCAYVRAKRDERDNPQPLTYQQILERIGKPVYIPSVGKWEIICSIWPEMKHIRMYSGKRYLFDTTKFYATEPKGDEAK